MSATKPSARKSTPAPQGARSEDAIALLTHDHKDVKTLFKRYDKLVEAKAKDDEKAVVAQEICLKLTVHATVEEEIFYPAARAVLGADEDLIDEADVEHATAKELIAQLEGSRPGDDALYDAKVKVLSEYVKHHVKEEQNEMFPKVKASSLDMVELGARMAARKVDLLAMAA